MRKKQKQRYKPLSDATPEEMQEAMQVASYWLADELEGHTESGAFSEAFLGDEARLIFIKKAYNTLKSPDCNWKWKEGTKLSTLMINVIRSDMAHELRRYIDQGKPKVVVTSSMKRKKGGADDEWDDANDVLEVDPDLKRNDFDVQTEMEMLEELEREESLREKGLKVARAAVKGDAMMEKFVEAVFELPDYRSISKKLKITQTDVKELEARLIAIFAVKKKR